MDKIRKKVCTLLSIGHIKLHTIKNNILDFYSLSINNTECSADLLLIRVDSIGDYIIWQDSLRGYKEKYAGKKVILLCNQIVYPIAILEPFFSEVWVVDRRKFIFSYKYRLEFTKRLHSCFFAQVISPVLSRDYLFSDTIVSLALSKEKIGYKGDLSNTSPKEKSKSDCYYTRLIENPTLPNHELIVNGHFIKQLFEQNLDVQLPKLPFISNSESDLLNSTYVVFSISASYYPRAWSAVSFAEVANLIANDYIIVLLGFGKMDREKGNEFLNQITNPSRVKDLINKTSIVDTIDIISKAAFVIGNDSSAVHIAAATRTPSICIAAGAHYNRFVPYPESVPDKYFHPKVVASLMPCFGCNYCCSFPIEDQLKCIKDVTTTMVVKEVNKLLDEIINREYES